MGLLDDTEMYFSTRCLYAVLEVAKDSSEKQLKKAYYLLSLKFHPDRSQNEDDKEGQTKKFQVLSHVHDVLSNPEQRAVYDETGELLDDSDILSKDKNWNDYWRLLFKKISKKDIEEFEEEYKGSEKEKEDVLGIYLQFEGDMGKIISNVMCTTYDDEPRIRSIIQCFIDNDEVSEFDAFTHEAKSKKRKRVKQGEREEREAEQHAKDIGLNVNGDLEALILKRNVDRGKEFDSLLSNLEVKYAKKGKTSKKGKETANKGKGKKRKK